MQQRIHSRTCLKLRHLLSSYWTHHSRQLRGDVVKTEFVKPPRLSRKWIRLPRSVLSLFLVSRITNSASVCPGAIELTRISISSLTGRNASSTLIYDPIEMVQKFVFHYFQVVQGFITRRREAETHFYERSSHPINNANMLVRFTRQM